MKGICKMLAPHLDIDTIAITRTFDGIETAAHRVISQVGGMASVVRNAKIAVLKPNFVAGRSAATGATTNFSPLKALREKGSAFWAETSPLETPPTEIYT